MASARWRSLGAGALLGVALLAACNGQDETAGGGGRFEVALIGDARYRPDEHPKFLRVRDAINARGVAFTIHVGDIKGGGSCGDAVYAETLRLFDSFSSPLVYTPGDNEWTDCGDRRPRERLAFLRRLFFPDDRSRGQRRMTLERQSRDFPENARWQAGPVTFATLHVVGSNDNLPDASRPEGTVGDAGEHTARKEANLAWLAAAFQHARSAGSAGLVLAMHADPAFERPPELRPGYRELLNALAREALGFAKPVVLVHGDSHVARVDRPLADPGTGQRVENLTRVETFGSPDVHWVRLSVDPDDRGVFTVRQELIEANRAP